MKNAVLLEFLERLPAAVVVADTANGEILWVNGPHARLSGVSSPDKVLGRSIFDFLTPDQLAVAMRDIDAVSRGETPPPIVYHVRRIDGGTADVHIASTAVIFDRRPAMVSVIVDVTDSQRAISDLSRREARYRDIVDGLPAAILVTVRDDIVYANAAFAHAMGHAGPEEFIGQSPSRFFDAPSRARVREARARSLVDGSDQSVEVDVAATRADGRRVEATGSISALEWDGEAATGMVLRARRAGV